MVEKELDQVQLLLQRHSFRAQQLPGFLKELDAAAKWPGTRCPQWQ
jgi:hypothetical protein